MPNEKKVSEDIAAALYIDTIAERIKRDWDKIHQSVKELAGDKKIIINEKQAIIGFLQANLAIGMQATKNIFTPQQADRLNKSIMNHLDDVNRQEIIKYKNIYENAAKELDEPVGTVAGALIFNWIGKDKVKLNNLGLRLQFLCMGISGEFLINGKYWQNIKENYDLVES